MLCESKKEDTSPLIPDPVNEYNPCPPPVRALSLMNEIPFPANNDPPTFMNSIPSADTAPQSKPSAIITINPANISFLI